MVEDIQTIEKKVKEVLAKNLQTDREKITLDSSLVDDLGMDSFGSVEVIFEMEDKFGIEIPEKDLVEVKTVRDIVNYISSKLDDIDKKQ